MHGVAEKQRKGTGKLLSLLSFHPRSLLLASPPPPLHRSSLLNLLFTSFFSLFPSSLSSRPSSISPISLSHYPSLSLSLFRRRQRASLIPLDKRRQHTSPNSQTASAAENRSPWPPLSLKHSHSSLDLRATAAAPANLQSLNLRSPSPSFTHSRCLTGPLFHSLSHSFNPPANGLK